jgi:hypothetical protein
MKTAKEATKDKDDDDDNTNGIKFGASILQS